MINLIQLTMFWLLPLNLPLPSWLLDVLAILGCVQSENKTGRFVGAGAISASAKFVTIMCKMLFSVDGLRVLNSQSGKVSSLLNLFILLNKRWTLTRTSGMSTSSTSSSTYKRKTAYDPQRQWGLKPEDGSIGDGATYVVSGHVVSGTSSDPRTTYLTENIGRDGQAKAKRKMGGGQDAADRALKALLERDKEGMKAVMSARESGKVLVNSEEGRNGRNKCEQGKGDHKGKRKQVADDACGQEPDACEAKKKRPSSYSAGIIRSLGFDPSIKTGPRRTDKSSSQNKVYFPLLLYLVLLSLFTVGSSGSCPNISEGYYSWPATWP